MADTEVLSGNPSLAETLSTKSPFASPTMKRSAVAPFDIAPIATPEGSSRKKLPQQETVPSIGQVTLIKTSKLNIPAGQYDSDGEISASRHRKEASTGDSSKSARIRPSSVSSDPGPRGQKSILKKSQYANGQKAERTGRRDANGVLIKKGGKQHKINFKQIIDEVKVVENWKEYNSNDAPHDNCCNLF